MTEVTESDVPQADDTLEVSENVTSDPSVDPIDEGAVVESADEDETADASVDEEPAAGWPSTPQGQNPFSSRTLGTTQVFIARPTFWKTSRAAQESDKCWLAKIAL